MINTRQLGPITVNISDQQEFLDGARIKNLEDFINGEWRKVVPESFKPVNYAMKTLGVPSLALRVDCSPDGLEKGIYEADANPYGLALSTLVESSTVMSKYIECLKILGISALKVKTYASAIKLDADAKVFEEQIRNAGIKISDDASYAQLWASNFDVGESGFAEDLSRSLMYSLESKLNLVPLGMATFVSSLFYSELGDEEIREILNKNFPDGYVVKPVDGWGCGYKDPIGFRIVPSRKPFKSEGDTQTAGVRMIKQILQSGKGAEYIIQHFYPPRLAEVEGQKGFQLYRLYLVFDPVSGQYKYAGGWFNFSRSIRGHGTNKTIFGWVK